MYHYIEDKKFLGEMRRECSDIINRLVQHINSEDVMEVEAHLVGSGAKHLETQNGKNQQTSIITFALLKPLSVILTTEDIFKNMLENRSITY